MEPAGWLAGPCAGLEGDDGADDGGHDVAGEGAGGRAVCWCCPRRVLLGEAGGVEDPASEGGRWAAARLRGGLLPLGGGSGGGGPCGGCRTPGPGDAAAAGALPSLGVGGSPLEQAMEQ